MESAQKRARERRKREKQQEKRERKAERAASASGVHGAGATAEPTSDGDSLAPEGVTPEPNTTAGEQAQ